MLYINCACAGTSATARSNHASFHNALGDTKRRAAHASGLVYPGLASDFASMDVLLDARQAQRSGPAADADLFSEHSLSNQN
jgi:hypothetical protein